MLSYNTLIKRPIVSEKSTEKSESLNEYLFEVDLSASKNQITQAIETIYDVRVTAVRTSVRPGKFKRYGRFMAKKNGTKRAFVRIQEGQKIELFKDL